MNINIWGPIVWKFLHTLVAKIKEEKFNLIKVELLSTIKYICNVLPCPICREHASNYLSKINIDSINNKKLFEIYIFNLHNIVNKNKMKNIEDETILEKYKKFNLEECYKGLISVLLNSSGENITYGFKVKIHIKEIINKMNKIKPYIN